MNFNPRKETELSLSIEPNPNLIVQPLSPGATISLGAPNKGLFILNLSAIMKDDIWDDFGNKELAQSKKLHHFAAQIIAIANALEEFGSSLKAYPDIDDYELEEYEQPWDEMMEEMSNVFADGYKNIYSLVEQMEIQASGGFYT